MTTVASTGSQRPLVGFSVEGALGGCRSCVEIFSYDLMESRTNQPLTWDFPQLTESEMTKQTAGQALLADCQDFYETVQRLNRERRWETLAALAARLNELLERATAMGPRNRDWAEGWLLTPAAYIRSAQAILDNPGKYPHLEVPAGQFSA